MPPDPVLAKPAPVARKNTTAQELPACPACAKPAKSILGGADVACSGGCWMAPSEPKTWTFLAEQAAKARAWDGLREFIGDYRWEDRLATERKRGGLT
jgi:hypothetical protein